MNDKLVEYEIFCEARKNMNYYKGEVLPFIHKMCRKNMTSGDIDGFVWDYTKKIYIILEQKRKYEKHKESQDLHLKFMSAILQEMYFSDRFGAYKFYVFKVIGDPPFKESTIINMMTDEAKIISQKKLVDLLEMNILFEDL
jgi:hypothetical protein